MNDSKDFQDTESIRSGNSHVTSRPVSFPPHPMLEGMLRHSFVTPNRREGPPSIWDTHDTSGNVFVTPDASSSAPHPQLLNQWNSSIEEPLHSSTVDCRFRMDNSRERQTVGRGVGSRICVCANTVGDAGNEGKLRFDPGWGPGQRGSWVTIDWVAVQSLSVGLRKSKVFGETLLRRAMGLSGRDEAAHEVASAQCQVKMKDAHKLLKIPKSECPDIWIRLPRHKWPKSWSSIEDPVVLLGRNLNGHLLAGLLWERQFEKIILKHGWEKVSNLECFFVHGQKGLFLCVCG